MEGHAKKCVERYCELAKKQIKISTRSQLHALTTTKFKDQEMGSVGEMSEAASQTVFKCLYLARIGRPDILMVCEQTCTCYYQVDLSMRPTNAQHV